MLGSNVYARTLRAPEKLRGGRLNVLHGMFTGDIDPRLIHPKDPNGPSLEGVEPSSSQGVGAPQNPLFEGADPYGRTRMIRIRMSRFYR